MPDETNNNTHATETDAHDNDPAARIADLESQLAEERASAAQLRRRQSIDEALREAKAVDLETARLVVEASLDAQESDDGDAAPDVGAIVGDLKKRKPFLFEIETRATPARRSAAQSPRVPPKRPDDAEQAAAEAQMTGRRADLLRYLRLRRQRE